MKVGDIISKNNSKVRYLIVDAGDDFWITQMIQDVIQGSKIIKLHRRRNHLSTEDDEVGKYKVVGRAEILYKEVQPSRKCDCDPDEKCQICDPEEWDESVDEPKVGKVSYHNADMTISPNAAPIGPVALCELALLIRAQETGQKAVNASDYFTDALELYEEAQEYLQEQAANEEVEEDDIQPHHML